MRLLLTFISILCLLRLAAADNGFRSRQYSAADGLPNHTVRHIMQDSHGFIWIGTLNGLTRYDGSRFTIFRSEPENPLSLSDNRVYYITEDNDNYLWIETTGRIYSCFDLQTGDFVRYTEGVPEPYNKVFLAGNGDVWLSNTDGGALRVSHTPGRGLKSEIFDKASGTLPADGVNTVFETHDGTILIGTPAGFTRVKGPAIGLAEGKEDIFSFFEVAAMPYAVTAGGKIWRIEGTVMSGVGTLPQGVKVTGVIPAQESVTVFTDQGIWLTDLRSGKTVPHPELDIKRGEVILDNKGRHWVYNHTGQLTYHSRKDNRYHTLHLIPSDIMERTDHERYRVVEDEEGTVWISTYGNGLFAYREDDGSLRHFSAGKDALIGSNSLRGMLLDSTGTLWLGTGQSGISTIWRDPRDTRHFLPDSTATLDVGNSIRALTPAVGGRILISTKDGKVYDWHPGDSSAEIAVKFQANVYSMLSDGIGETAYGTRGDGLYLGQRHFRHIASDRTSLPNDNIYFIHRDRKGRVWAGTFGGGLALMKPDDEKGFSFRSFFSDTHGRNEQRHLIEDLDGRFWIGTSEGLLTFHPDSLLSDPKRFKTYSKNNNELECNEVRHLMRDSKGELWLATGNDGVIRATTTGDGSLKVLNHYTAADGLANNSVQSITEDDTGNIWVATQYGLSRLNRETGNFENFIFSDGPQGNTYAEGSVLKLKDGTLLFGTSRGVTVIDPEKYTATDKSRYPLRFTGLFVNGVEQIPGADGSALTEAPDYTDGIVLKPRQNSFSVNFSAMDFRDNARFRYSYILEGHDEEWSSPSPEGTASFSYLPSGSYTLKVRCLEGGRVVAEESFGIRVMAPWWRTWWAFIAYALIILCMTWALLRRKVGRHGSCVREPSDSAPMRSNQETEQHPEEKATSSDLDFLTKLEAAARENLANPSFSVDDFASTMNLGRAVFYRKLKEVADITPNEYLKKMRMQEAACLLQTAPDLNIAEIADRVGFSDSLYFSKCFKAEFGQSPTRYRLSLKS